MTEDAGGYYQDALWILEGKDISPFWPPGIPYFLAAWMWITSPSLTSAVAGMLLWYLAFCWLFILLARQWLSHRSIQILLAGYAIYPTFLHHSVAPLSHLPVAVCLLGGLVLMLRISSASQNRPTTKLLIELTILGLVWALMVLFRPATLLIIPVFAMGLFALLRKWSKRSFLWSMLPVLLASTLLGSWELYLHHIHHRWVGINDATAMNLFIGNQAQTPLYKTWWLGSHDETRQAGFEDFYQTREAIRSLPMADQKDAFFQQAWQHIQDRPDLFVIRTLNRIRCFFAFDTYAGARTISIAPVLAACFLLIDGVLFLLLGYLLILGWKSQQIPKAIRCGFSLLILVYAVPYSIAFAHPTYHLAILPLAGILAGCGLEANVSLATFSSGQKAGIAILGLIQLEWLLIMAAERLPPLF